MTDADVALHRICSEIHNSVYEIKESLALYEFIGQHAAELNNHADGPFLGQFLGTVQRLAAKTALIETAKLLEEQDDYQLLNISGALCLLRDVGSALPPKNLPGIISRLNNAGANPIKTGRLGEETATSFVATFLAHKLGALKSTRGKIAHLRDKRLAHLEAIDKEMVPAPLLQEVDDVVGFAILLLDVVWYGYRGISTNFSSWHSERTTKALARLLRRAGIDLDDSKIQRDQ